MPETQERCAKHGKPAIYDMGPGKLGCADCAREWAEHHPFDPFPGNSITTTTGN